MKDFFWLLLHVDNGIQPVIYSLLISDKCSINLLARDLLCAISLVLITTENGLVIVPQRTDELTDQDITENDV